jgi:flagellar biosynthesis protein FlhF
METKTYFASSVQAAMDAARRELGADAMLVNARPAPETARAFGRWEVTFAWETAGTTASAVPGGAGAARVEAVRQSVETGPHRRESGLEDIRVEISALRNAFGRQSGVTMLTPEAGSEIDHDAVQSLCDTGMEKDTAHQIASAAANDSGHAGGGFLRELTTRIPVAEFSPLAPDESRTLAFVGPPGRGKTASLVKIAVRYGLAKRIPTRIQAAGAHGVGATEQMARYAAILGVPFQAMESFEGLNLAMQGDRWKGLSLIDTPGLVASDRREMEAMTKFFARRTDIERHLVIRAEARSADMRYILAQFASVQPSRLLFTGVDEARGLGAAADTMIHSGIAGSFFGTGPQIPDDLEEVNVAKLARSLWAPMELAGRAAA